MVRNFAEKDIFLLVTRDTIEKIHKSEKKRYKGEKNFKKWKKSSEICSSHQNLCSRDSFLPSVSFCLSDF